MNSKRLLQLLTALFLLVIPASASAQSSFIQDALAGSALDPLATTVRVVPPKGGTVMVYRQSQLVGWWMRPGIAAVAPNQVYGVVATRGSQTLFSGRILVRPGATQLLWSDSDLPQIAYQPLYQYQRPAYVGASRVDGVRPASANRPGARQQPQRQGATVRPRNRQLSSGKYFKLVREMQGARGDRARLGVLRGYASRYRFRSDQRRGVLALFKTPLQRRHAAKLLRARPLPKKQFRFKRMARR